MPLGLAPPNSESQHTKSDALGRRTATSIANYGFRYYSPSMGRFLNRDPLLEDGGINIYAMTGNNPIGRWDYLGLDPVYDEHGDYLGDDDPVDNSDFYLPDLDKDFSMSDYNLQDFSIYGLGGPDSIAGSYSGGGDSGGFINAGGEVLPDGTTVYSNGLIVNLDGTADYLPDLHSDPFNERTHGLIKFTLGVGYDDDPELAAQGIAAAKNSILFILDSKINGVATKGSTRLQRLLGEDNTLMIRLVNSGEMQRIGAFKAGVEGDCDGNYIRYDPLNGTVERLSPDGRYGPVASMTSTLAHEISHAYDDVFCKADMIRTYYLGGTTDETTAVKIENEMRYILHQPIVSMYGKDKVPNYDQLIPADWKSRTY